MTETMILPAASLSDPVDRAQMRVQTHDGLLEMIEREGAVQVGRIAWRWWFGKDTCSSVLRAMYADDDRPIKTFGLDQFEAFFEQHPADCCLVIASVEVRR